VSIRESFLESVEQRGLCPTGFSYLLLVLPFFGQRDLELVQMLLTKMLAI
jgi:hypothetical protein